jgi:uncharacterized membrane protein
MQNEPPKRGEEQAPPAPHEDIDAMLAIRARTARSRTGHQRFLERVTKVVGRPASVYLIVLSAIAWMACNYIWAHGGPEVHAPDPPPFAGLELVVSLLALVATVTILSTQNRERQSADDRSHLDLQINLLAERKIAKLIALVEELRTDMPDVRNRVDRVANQMKESVDPHAVLNALAEATDASGARVDSSAHGPDLPPVAASSRPPSGGAP